MKRNRFTLKTALTAGLIAAISTTALAESIWIKSEVVDIRAGKGAVFPVVAKAKKGQELTVTAHEGKWIKVSIPAADPAGAPIDGYVYETAISPTKVGGGLELSAGGVSQMSTGAAAKGLLPDAENYASGKKMDSGPLNRLIAARDKINPQELEQFMAAGRVGAH